MNNNLKIGNGNLAGKGIFANKNFRKGDIVVKYKLQAITQKQFEKLASSEKQFVHKHWGQLYLYGKPERYVNDSKNPNTLPDLKLQCDIAIRDIQIGEEITTDSSEDDI